MNRAVRTTLILARRRVAQIVTSPGIYIVLSLMLLLGYVLTTGFAAAVDASGFDPSGDPVYAVLTRAVVAVFGDAFAETLFSEGPLLLFLYGAFVPLLLFVVMGSVFRLSFERKVGALDLLRYGPVSIRSNIVAEIATDVLVVGIGLVLVSVFSFVAAAVLNLVVGRAFLWSIPLLVAFTLSLSAVGTLCFTLVENPASSLLIFVAIVSGLLLLGVGSFAGAGAASRPVFRIMHETTRWISPVNFWLISVRGAGTARWSVFALGLVLQLALTGTCLVVADLNASRKGRRQ